MSVTELRVPQETVSDQSVVLAQWHVAHGSEVQPDTVVATVEASKAVFDIEADSAGFIFYDLEPGDEVAVGGVLAVIAKRPDFDYEEYLEPKGKPPAQDASGASSVQGARFSRGAAALIEEHSIDAQRFAGAGLVTEKHVRSVLEVEPQQEEAGPHAAERDKGNYVVIVGGGGHARMCIDIIRQQQSLRIAGILDDGIPEGEEVLGVSVLGPLDRLREVRSQGITFAVNGIGAATNHPLRSDIYQRIKNAEFIVPNIIHPSAVVEPSATLGEGNQIMAGAIVGSAAQIGSNCIVNSGSVVSHDCVFGDNVHVAPGAVLAGEVRVGTDTLVGMGATVYLGVTLGERVVVMNGYDVFEDVASGEVRGTSQ